MSGALLMAASMPRAAAGGGVSINDRTVFKGGNGTVTVQATYILDHYGTVRNHNLAILETWLLSGAAGDYESRATLQSGTTPTTGTMNTWQALSSDESWSLAVAAGSTDTSVILVEIRDVATSTVQDSASITLQVDNTP